MAVTPIPFLTPFSQPPKSFMPTSPSLTSLRDLTTSKLCSCWTMHLAKLTRKQFSHYSHAPVQPGYVVFLYQDNNPNLQPALTIDATTPFRQADHVVLTPLFPKQVSQQQGKSTPVSEVLTKEISRILTGWRKWAGVSSTVSTESPTNVIDQEFTRALSSGLFPILHNSDNGFQGTS